MHPSDSRNAARLQGLVAASGGGEAYEHPGDPQPSYSKSFKSSLVLCSCPFQSHHSLYCFSFSPWGPTQWTAPPPPQCLTREILVNFCSVFDHNLSPWTQLSGGSEKSQSRKMRDPTLGQAHHMSNPWGWGESHLRKSTLKQFLYLFAHHHHCLIGFDFEILLLNFLFWVLRHNYHSAAQAVLKFTK